MIRKETFGMDVDSFAAQRREILNRADEKLTDPATWSVLRFGLPGWEDNLVTAALKVFNSTAEQEVEEWTQVLDDLRDAFELELRTTLKKTTRSKNPDAQMQSLVRWVSTMAVNAGTEAATTADPGEDVGLEWVTMGDGDVRHSHKEANGQTVPSGQTFDIGGEALLYPGQPVGDPSAWYNCRCVVRPTMLTSALTAAAEDADTDNVTVIVALPAADSPINDISSEEDGAHVTLLFLGPSDAFEPRPIADVLALTAEQMGMPVTDEVNGSAVLGEHEADVALIDARNLAKLRGVILATDEVRAVHDTVEQFPAWIPHLTLGYPESPRNPGEIPEEITFDRLALWHGKTKTEFTLAPKPVESIVAAAEVEAEPVSAEDLPDGIMIDESAFQPIPWHGVLCPEGIPSGDGRMFAANSLSNRPLPLPLTYQFASADKHGGSVVVGRIDRIFRDGGLIKGEGVFDSSPMAYESIRQLANGMFRGVSVEVDDFSGEIDETNQMQVTTSGRLTGSTLVATPAFPEAFVALGPWDDDVSRETGNELVTNGDELELSGETAQFAPVPAKTKDGPGWITNPNDTKRITDYWVDGRGAAKIGWGVPGDFERCRTNLIKYVQNPEWLAGLCANLHYRALRVWPGAHTIETSGLEADTKAEALVASAVMAEAEVAVSADWFRDPGFDGPSPMRITDDGHVYGHLARWDTCHIGSIDRDGGCVTAPPSATNYAYFLTGEVVTDAGRVAVGQITMGGGHASERAGMRAAASHYDSTSSVVADVTVGEDDYGIWVSGSIRDGVEPKQVRTLMASTLSGDWRRVVVGGRGNLELVAALAVNVPGFPTPRTKFSSNSLGQMSLIAAGALAPAAVEDAGTIVSENNVDVDGRISSSRFAIRQARIAKAKRALLVGK